MISKSQKYTILLNSQRDRVSCWESITFLFSSLGLLGLVTLGLTIESLRKWTNISKFWISSLNLSWASEIYSKIACTKNQLEKVYPYFLSKIYFNTCRWVTFYSKH